MSLAKTLLTAFAAQSLAAIASAQIRSTTISGPVTGQSAAMAANTEAIITNAAGSSVTNATDAQVIHDVPNVTQNPLFYAMLQNGIQPRNETSTTTLGDL